MSSTASITGITGQDGSYLAEFLLERGYRMAGMTWRTSMVTSERIEHLIGSPELVQGDLLDQNSVTQALRYVHPDEVYNLAAHSFVPTTWNQPVLISEFTAHGVPGCLRQFAKSTLTCASTRRAHPAGGPKVRACYPRRRKRSLRCRSSC